MKKQIIKVLFLFILLKISAQRNTIDITGGYTIDGYAININYNIEKQINKIKVGFFVTKSIDKKSTYKIPYNIINGSVGYFINFFENRKQNFILSGGIDLIFGYEFINKLNSIVIENNDRILSKSSFIYGGSVSIEAEYNLNPNFSILIKGTEFYHFNSSLGSAMPYLGGGIKFLIN